MRGLMIPAAMMLVAAAPAETGIRQAMEASAAGWNANDLDRFMAVYADDATFVTPKGLLRGKAVIAAHYARSFAPGGNARGRLTFAFLAFRPIDATHQLLVARWTLTGAKVETGMTTLLFERRAGMWRIVADHSS